MIIIIISTVCMTTSSFLSLSLCFGFNDSSHQCQTNYKKSKKLPQETFTDSKKHQTGFMVLNKNTADQRLIFVSLAVVLSGELYHVHHCRSPLIYSYLIRCWLVWHLVLFFCLYFILQALLLFFSSLLKPFGQPLNLASELPLRPSRCLSYWIYSL